MFRQSSFLSPADDLELEEEGLIFPPSQARRDPMARGAHRFANELRRQGFLPSQHFAHRLLERALARGVRFDPSVFASEFQRARHFRQTRPGYHTRIAVVRGLPILYRMGGERGTRIVLVGLLPEGARPPVIPTPRPRRRERERMVPPDQVWLSPINWARNLANQILNRHRQAARLTGPRSGRAGDPYFRASRELQQLANSPDYLPEVKAELARQAHQFLARGRAINHPERPQRGGRQREAGSESMAGIPLNSDL